MANRLVEVRELRTAKMKQVADIFAAYPDYSMPAEVVTDLQARNAELKDIGEEYDRLEAMDQARKANDENLRHFTQPVTGMVHGGKAAGNGLAPERQPFSVAGMLEENKSYAAFRRGEVKTVAFELDEIEAKTLITLTDMGAQAQRVATVPSAQAFKSVSDLFLDGTTNSNAIEYYEETTFTNNAAEVAEGVAKPESAISFTLRTDNVRKIATWVPATDEVLSDNAQLRSYIEGRLRFMVMKRRDAQLLNGDGTAPNISGITDRSGIQTQAKGADPVFDAILKAITKVRVTGDAEPTAAVFHPNDWQDLLLTRTTDGIYLMGNPNDPGVADRIWGLTVRVVPAQTENTAIVGAFTPYAQIFRREGLTITISTEHSTYFTENKVAILAEERLALAVYRPAAFCTVTGI